MMLKKVMTILLCGAIAAGAAACAGKNNQPTETPAPTAEYGDTDLGDTGANTDTITDATNPPVDGAAEQSDATASPLEGIDLSKLVKGDDVALPQLGPVNKGETIAVMETSMGTIKIRFFPEYAPNAVENFVTHAKEGYYDGLTFHRIVEQFMIQGGDPLGNGTGGESIFGEPFAPEVTNSLHHIRGALSMARSSEPVSQGSQFFIVQNNKVDETYAGSIRGWLADPDQPAVQGDGTVAVDENGDPVSMSYIFPKRIMQSYIDDGGTPFLDYGYTVFGQVIEGMDVVDKIAAVETDENDKPLTEVKINKITVTEY